MRRLLISLLSLLAAVTLAEGGSRIWLWARGVPWSAREARIDAQRVVSGMTESTPVLDRIEGEQEKLLNREAVRRNLLQGNELHPYTGYDASKTPDELEALLEWEANERGDTVVVYLLGGSVAMNFLGGLHGVSEEATRALAELSSYQGRDVRWVSLARPGFKQPQQLTKLTYLLSRGARPDIVINLDGYNEVHLGHRNGVKGYRVSWPSYGHWSFVGRDPLRGEGLELVSDKRALEREASELLARAERWGLLRSAITGSGVLRRIHTLQRDWVAQQEALVNYLDQGKDATRPQGERRLNPLMEALQLWAECSRLMHTLCQSRGIRYVHALQPTLHDEGSKKVHPLERRRGLEGGACDPIVVAGYQRMRQDGAALREEGIEFLDASQVFAEVEEPLYYDRCHFEKPGNELLLAAFLSHLEEAALEEKAK